MRSNSTLSIAAAVALVLSLAPFATAQSNAEWIAYKQKCGIPSNMAYNDWVAAGSKCNTASSTGAPTLTPQQQTATAIGKVGADMIGQGLHQLFVGPPIDPATQQRALAAQQLHNSGIYLMRQCNLPGAINEFQKALALTPNDPAIKRDLQQALDLQAKSAVAGKTSQTLGSLLGGSNAAPASAANKPCALVSVAPIPEAPTLPAPSPDRPIVPPGPPATHAPKISIDSLKTQIDSLFGTDSGPVTPPPPTPQQIDDIFAGNPHPDQSSSR